MIQATLDTKSPFQVRWPRSDAAIIRLGQAFLTAEVGWAEEQRFPKLDLIQQRLTAAVAAREAAQSGEAQRSIVSAAEQLAFEQAKALMRKIIAGLSYRHLNELPVLEQWGIAVVQSRSGFQSRAPRTKLALLDMLVRYVAQENSLPETERLTDPPLVEVTATLNALQTAMAERQTALTQRGVSVRTRSVEAQALLDLIQVASLYHVAVTFDGVVDRRLQELGLDVVER